MASQYLQILEAAKAAVMILPEFADCGGEIRERPFCSEEHGDKLPFVSFSGTTETVENLYRGERALFDYPVYVTVFTAKGSTLQSNAAMRLKYERREAIRHALWRPRLHPSQGKARYEPNPAWDFAGLDKLFDVSIQCFVYNNDEPC